MPKRGPEDKIIVLHASLEGSRGFAPASWRPIGTGRKLVDSERTRRYLRLFVGKD